MILSFLSMSDSVRMIFKEFCAQNFIRNVTAPKSALLGGSGLFLTSCQKITAYKTKFVKIYPHYIMDICQEKTENPKVATTVGLFQTIRHVPTDSTSADIFPNLAYAINPHITLFA